jgi:phosphatidylglycerophosphate synthase
MKFKQFYNEGYPKKFARIESQKNFIYLLHRRIGIFLAYLFYRLGISANMLSIIRLLMSIAGLLFIAKAASYSQFLPLGGAFLIYGQVVLDFSDGVIARVQKRTSKVGFYMDWLGCDIAHIGIIILAAIFTRNIFIVIICMAATYILTAFRFSVFDLLPENSASKFIKKIIKRLLSDQVIVVVLPFIMAGFSLFKWDIKILSYFIVSVYVTLSVIWLALCTAKG